MRVLRTPPSVDAKSELVVRVAKVFFVHVVVIVPRPPTEVLSGDASLEEPLAPASKKRVMGHIYLSRQLEPPESGLWSRKCPTPKSGLTALLRSIVKRLHEGHWRQTVLISRYLKAP